jgi:hypothetical protein
MFVPAEMASAKPPISEDIAYALRIFGRIRIGHCRGGQWSENARQLVPAVPSSLRQMNTRVTT